MDHNSRSISGFARKAFDTEAAGQHPLDVAVEMGGRCDFEIARMAPAVERPIPGKA